MMRETSIVNNVGWKILNDNNTRNSHLEETEYAGNKYTPAISERGIIQEVLKIKLT